MESEKGDWQLTKTCVQERFKQLLCLSRWTDCTFRVGDDDVQVVHGHRLVLAVSSPVFEALFYGSMASPPDEVISIPDIEPNTFRTFLQYLYSDEVDIRSIEEAGELLYAAKKYLVQPLAVLCLNYLVQHTWIKTLWEVLLVAEALSEEKLLASCIKVMSRYRYQIWNLESENLSVSTMQKLLEQEEMNMSEAELWEMVLDWARKELESRQLPDSPQARRTLIDSAGLISKIRFLSMSSEELDRFIGVLSEQEVVSLKAQTDIPTSFNKEVSLRQRAPPLVWRSSRDILSNRNQLWVNRGEVICNICSSSRVLVIGFEIFTRLAQITSFVKTPSNCSYREKLVIFIKDYDGNVIQKTDYDSIVRFNDSQNINLARPLWFEPDVKYTVNIGFIGGLYPICKYSDGSSRGTKFFFDETMLLEGPGKVPASFIISVLYAL